jgi:hypothetical protein
MPSNTVASTSLMVNRSRNEILDCRQKIIVLRNDQYQSVIISASCTLTYCPHQPTHLASAHRAYRRSPERYSHGSKLLLTTVEPVSPETTCGCDSYSASPILKQLGMICSVWPTRCRMRPRSWSILNIGTESLVD